MTSLPPHDPLVALWQTAPQPGTQDLLRELQPMNPLHRRLNRTMVAIICGISLLRSSRRVTGRVATQGMLSVIWILGFAIGVAWHGRARYNRSDALTLDTVSLLKFRFVRKNRG
jgi:hypothetical protein